MIRVRVTVGAFSPVTFSATMRLFAHADSLIPRTRDNAVIMRQRNVQIQSQTPPIDTMRGRSEAVVPYDERGLRRHRAHRRANQAGTWGARFSLYIQHESTLAQRNMSELVARPLDAAATPFNPDQKDQLVAALARYPAPGEGEVADMS